MNYQSGALGKPCMHPKKNTSQDACNKNKHLIFFHIFVLFLGSVQIFPMVSPLHHQGIMLKSKERAVRLHKDGGFSVSVRRRVGFLGT